MNYVLIDCIEKMYMKYMVWSSGPFITYTDCKVCVVSPT